MKRCLMLLMLVVSARVYGGSQPQLVAPGVISTGDDEFGAALTPDGSTLYFNKADPRGGLLQMIVYSTKSRRGWSTPRVASFSGKYRDIDPAISPDGQRLVFASDRPRTAGGTVREDRDLWMVTRTASGWSEPVFLDAVNSDASESNSSIAADGTLYFVANDRKGGPGKRDLYRSTWVDGRYQEPVLIGAPISTEDDDSNHFIAPDQSYLLFCSTRPGGLGKTDLYISFAENGGWSEPINLGKPINGGVGPFTPLVSPDGKTLWFTTRRDRLGLAPDHPLRYSELIQALRSPGNGGGDLYTVDFDPSSYRPQ